MIPSDTRTSLRRALCQLVILTHHDAGVELVEALHGAIAEAVAQVFLHKVGVVQDVVGHQGLLPLTCSVRREH